MRFECLCVGGADLVWLLGESVLEQGWNKRRVGGYSHSHVVIPPSLPASTLTHLIIVITTRGD